MSSSEPPTDPLPTSTRQMLDELDALMERMLALPVNDLEDGPPVLSSPPLSGKVTVVEAPPAPVEASRPPLASPPPSKVLVGRLSALPSYTTEVEKESHRPHNKIKQETRPNTVRAMAKHA